MTTKFMSNMSRTFSNSGFSRTYSSAPKPFHFTKLHQANMTPLPAPATHKPRKDRGSCMAVCCCCFTGCISMLITAAIGLGIAALIIWLVLRPIHSPTYDLRNVSISNLGYAPATHALDAAANYTIVAWNGNGKIGIKYDTINIDTSYQGQVFDHTVIPGFYHGHRQNVSLAQSFITKGFVMEPAKGAMLQTHIDAGDVPLLMRVNVVARLKIGAITTPKFNVHVNCDVNIRPPRPAVGATAAAPAAVLRQTCKKVYMKPLDHFLQLRRQAPAGLFGTLFSAYLGHHYVEQTTPELAGDLDSLGNSTSFAHSLIILGPVGEYEGDNVTLFYTRMICTFAVVLYRANRMNQLQRATSSGPIMLYTRFLKC